MLINSLKCATVKKKKKKKKKKNEILKIVEFFWIITHNSQRITILSVSMVKGKCKIKQKTEQIER